MYLVKTNWWIRKLFPANVTWNIRTHTKEVFLTFDDGPHPTITPFVLECLAQYGAKATFFCIGNNVRLFPATYKQIVDAGHAIGNHTYDHVNGWKTPDKEYVNNVGHAAQLIESRLFRPPYGRITRQQVQQLAPAYKIVMWEVLSGDFDRNLSPTRCYDNVVSNTRQGSIIVFHDSEKAFPRLEFALPGALKYFFDNGYAMNSIGE